MCFFPIEATTVETQPAIEWEECRCSLCGGRQHKPLIESSDRNASCTGMWFVVVQCQECGLCFTNPRPSRQSIARFYANDYKPHHKLPSTSRRPGPLARWFGIEHLRDSLPWHGEGRLLDFGCGGGAFLHRMKQQGWRVLGIDISPAAVTHARRHLGLDVLLGTLPHPDLAPRSFDVVTMWEVLEHLHDPLDTLRQVRRLLVPGGRLVVSVPNIDSLPFRWFQQDWIGLDLPRHLIHFAPWTLPLMLERAGFRPGPVRMQRHTSWMRQSARRACQQPRRPYWLRWLTARPVAGLAAWYSYLTQQADSLLITAER
jgi:2-polyprenyl-3-methyl-5-hydroxy-6-metoxy-1,4-benzoquinol methylase